MNAQAGYLATTLIHRYLGGLLDPFVTLLEVHKLMYFVQEAGASVFLDQHADRRERFERVARLVEGFESPHGLELLSTVPWVMTQEGVRQLDDVAARIHAWNPRKRQFTNRKNNIAAGLLLEQGWVGNRLS